MPSKSPSQRQMTINHGEHQNRQITMRRRWQHDSFGERIVICIAAYKWHAHSNWRWSTGATYSFRLHLKKICFPLLFPEISLFFRVRCNNQSFDFGSTWYKSINSTMATYWFFIRALCDCQHTKIPITTNSRIRPHKSSRKNAVRLIHSLSRSFHLLSATYRRTRNLQSVRSMRFRLNHSQNTCVLRSIDIKYCSIAFDGWKFAVNRRNRFENGPLSTRVLTTSLRTLSHPFFLVLQQLQQRLAIRRFAPFWMAHSDNQRHCNYW